MKAYLWCVQHTCLNKMSKLNNQKDFLAGGLLHFFASSAAVKIYKIVHLHPCYTMFRVVSLSTSEFQLFA